MAPWTQVAAQRVRHLFLLCAEALIVVYLALDALAAPLFRPLIRWFSRLRFVIRLQDVIAALPPYAILALLAVPFAIAEPAKLYAVVLLATGHVVIGAVLFILAYFVTFVVVERIYSAGRDKLRSIGWFARLIDWLFDFRDRVLAFVRATRAWAFFGAVKRRMAATIARLRLRFGLQ
jgi:hypothetical protein